MVDNILPGRLKKRPRKDRFMFCEELKSVSSDLKLEIRLWTAFWLPNGDPKPDGAYLDQ